MPFPHRSVVLVALVLGGLAGCVTNPYIHPARPDLPPNASASEKLRLAIDYADRVYEDYAAMPSLEFERQRKLSNGLLVTAAAALGMAAGQVHSDALLGTALIGGTAYQIGNWNSSPARLRIFIEARKSLACGREAVAPLDLSDAELDRVRTQVKATIDAARSASQAAGDVTRWLAEVSRSGSAAPLVATAEAELARHGERFEAAKRVVAHAAGAERLVGSAGGLLVAHVGKVRTLVDGALDDTQASLTTLPTAIADLGRSASIIAPSLDLESTFGKKLTAPAGGPAAGPKVNAESDCIDDQGRIIVCPENAVDPVGRLTEALGRLRARTGALEIETEALSALDPMALEKLRAAIVGCNPDLAQALKPLVARPETVEFVVGVPDAAVVGISGGTLPYASALQGASIPGVNTQVGPDRLVVKAGADTVAGDTQSVVFSDATGALVTVRIKINAKPAPAPAGTVTPPPADDAKAKARAAAEAKKKAAARKKAAAIAADGAAAAGGATVPAAGTAAPDAPPVAARQCEVEGARTDFECTLSKPQMRGIRARLGLARTPERFDAEVRARLDALQKKQSLPAGGNYDPATAQAVDALSGN